MDMHEKAPEHTTGDSAPTLTTLVASRTPSLFPTEISAERRTSSDCMPAQLNTDHEIARKSIAYQLLQAIGSAFKFKNVQALLPASKAILCFLDDGAGAKEYFKQRNIDTDVVELVALCTSVGIQKWSPSTSKVLKNA